MAKRIADKELTDRNWDQEEEGEEAGTFLLASEDVLKGRAIKKAKRRNVPEGEGSATFKGFKGFSLTTTTAAASGGGSAPTAFSGFGNGGGGFKGLSGLTNGSAPMFGGFSTHAAKPAATPGLTFNGPAPSDITAKQSNGSSSSPCVSTSVSTSASGKEYSRQLTALNVSVRDWITKHVNDNPLCDLNPIFRDYERHLASIERQYGAAAANANANDSEEKKKKPAEATPPPAPPPASSSSSSASLFSFNKSTADDSAKSGASASNAAAVTFNFGQKVDSAVLGSLGAAKMSPSFSFCTSSSSTSSSSSSSSGGQTSSLFGAAPPAPAPPAPAAAPSFTKTEENRPADENGDEESDEPPKPEVKEVKEDDAFYSKKCKLFYKKDSEFKEKGVGTLHLKNTEDSKVQMIIRADTNLGNILLNILLQASLPCSRVGQKHVMVVCVPNPPLDDKNPRDPVPLLIRVRTPQDADELLRTLEERKG